MLLHTRRGRVYVEDERPQIDARHGEGEGASARCLARRLKSEISRSDRQTTGDYHDLSPPNSACPLQSSPFIVYE